MLSNEPRGNDKKKGGNKKKGGASQQGEITNFYGFSEKQCQASNFLGKLSNSIKMMQVDKERH